MTLYEDDKQTASTKGTHDLAQTIVVEFLRPKVAC